MASTRADGRAVLINETGRAVMAAEAERRLLAIYTDDDHLGIRLRVAGYDVCTCITAQLIQERDRGDRDEPGARRSPVGERSAWAADPRPGSPSLVLRQPAGSVLASALWLLALWP